MKKGKGEKPSASQYPMSTEFGGGEARVSPLGAGVGVDFSHKFLKKQST